MNGGGCCLMAGKGGGILERKEKKKVFLSLFSLVAGGSCFLTPCQTAPAGVVLSFFLIWMAQNRKDQTFTDLGYWLLLVCFFRWRRTSPTFQVPQRVKFLPLVTGTVPTCGHVSCPSEDVQETANSAARLRIGRGGSRRVARSRCDFLFLLPRWQLRCRDNFNFVAPPARVLERVNGEL